MDRGNMTDKPALKRRWFRFSLRFLMLAVLFFGLVLGVVVQWWTRPYVLTGSYANGVRAWEQWERRTLTLKLQNVKTVRFYSNGQRGYEYDFADGKSKYWSPDGQPISEEKGLEYFSEDLYAENETEDDQSHRPMKSFIWWWNDW